MMTNLKAQVKKIIENISQLEKLQREKSAFTTLELKQNLIINTNELLRDAKEKTNKRFVKKIKKIKAKRRLRRKRSKQKILRPTPATTTTTTTAGTSKITKKSETNTQTPPPVKETPISIKKEPEENKQVVENEFRQLRNYQQAQRYLRTFELLEMLHYARSQDKQLTCQFREKLQSLRAIWNIILLENTPKRTDQRRIEDQWDQVIFGASEQTFYNVSGKKTERERIREFLRIRQTWDSYVVRSKKHGSCIPLGWVLPKQTVSEKWEQYKST